MKYIILTILLIYINDSKAESIKLHSSVRPSVFKVDIMQGFAYHYKAESFYNDSIFRDNKTSTNTLIRFTYSNYNIIGLSDSQGNGSIALTYNNRLYNNKLFNINSLLGVYIMRNDNQLYTQNPLGRQLPHIGIGSKDMTIMPLIGLEADLALNETISLSITITPAFTLFGLKFKLFK